MNLLRKSFGKKYRGGTTLIEVLVVVVIVMIIAGIVFLSFSSFRYGQALPNDVDEVTALLNEARSRTISADAGAQYGVHFDADKAVLFVGNTYTVGAAGNKQVIVNPMIQITSVFLNGGGTNVVFDKLTGETSQYGTLVEKYNDGSVNPPHKTITISKTGLVSSD